LEKSEEQVLPGSEGVVGGRGGKGGPTNVYTYKINIKTIKKEFFRF
jgi:hypothetical protein